MFLRSKYLGPNYHILFKIVTYITTIPNPSIQLLGPLDPLRCAWGLPIVSIVVPFGSSYIGSFKVLPLEPMGRVLKTLLGPFRSKDGLRESQSLAEGSAAAFEHVTWPA